MKNHSEVKALLKVCSLVFLSLSYCFFFVSKIPKGKLRLIFILPIVFLFTILPLSLSYVFTIGITASFVTWLTNSKLLLYAFDLGPLPAYTAGGPGSSDVRSLTSIKLLLSFIFVGAFPIKYKHPTSNSNNKPLNLWSKVLIASIMIFTCDKYRPVLHEGVILVIYSCLLFLLVDIAMGFSNMLVGPIMGVELSQPSDEPYVATSLQDFWGRRWNLMVTDTLRQTVYDPTRVFLSEYFGPNWATAVGAIASFLVSGLMHELIIYYVTRVSPTWETTWFFVLHGVCVALEVAVKRALGPKLRLGRAVSGPLTIGFVMGTGYLWFFPPIVENRVDLRVFEELKSVFGFFLRIFKLFM